MAQGRAGRVFLLALCVLGAVGPAGAEIVATPTPLPQRPLVATMRPLRREGAGLRIDDSRSVGEARFTTPDIDGSAAAARVPAASPTASPGMDLRIVMTAPLSPPAPAEGASAAIDAERRLLVVAGNCAAGLRGSRSGVEILGDFTSPPDGRAAINGHSKLGYHQLRGRSLLVVRPESEGFPEVPLACGAIGAE